MRCTLLRWFEFQRLLKIVSAMVLMVALPISATAQQISYPTEAEAPGGWTMLSAFKDAFTSQPTGQLTPEAKEGTRVIHINTSSSKTTGTAYHPLIAVGTTAAGGIRQGTYVISVDAGNYSSLGFPAFNFIGLRVDGVPSPNNFAGMGTVIASQTRSVPTPPSGGWATWTYAATYKIREVNYELIDTQGVTLLNTFKVTAATLVAPILSTTKTATATTNFRLNPKLSVIKTSALVGGGPIPTGGAAVGDVIEYTYTVRNDGNVAMSPVNLSDDHRGKGDPLVFGGCTTSDDLQTKNNTVLGTTDFQIQTFAPRDTVACTATYTVVQTDIDNLQ